MYWLSTAYLMLGVPVNTRLNHAVKWLFEKVLAVNYIFDVRWTWTHQAESCSQVTVWEGTGCQLHTWCQIDLTTPDWIMQSSDCLRRYWLSTAYLMLVGPDHTRLNHAAKWLFEKVLAVNCIFDVRMTFRPITEFCFAALHNKSLYKLGITPFDYLCLWVYSLVHNNNDCFQIQLGSNLNTPL